VLLSLQNSYWKVERRFIDFEVTEKAFIQDFLEYFPSTLDSAIEWCEAGRGGSELLVVCGLFFIRERGRVRILGEDGVEQ